MLTETEKKVAGLIQRDIPLAGRPFKCIADEIQTSEEEVVTTVHGLLKKGIIRKFGAVLRHQKAGFTHNAMVIWAAGIKAGAAGRALAAFREVTHCYERTPPFAGRYNLFSMIHCREGEKDAIIRKLSQAADIKDFKILMSEEEYKKSSMEYFTDVA